MSVSLVGERLNRGLNSRQAASNIGISQAILLKAENGGRPKSPRDAKAIADYYGYRVTDIWPVDGNVQALHPAGPDLKPAA